MIMESYKHQIHRCLNNKCKADITHLFYDPKEHIWYCNKCKTIWKVNKYHKPLTCTECNNTTLTYDRDRCEIYCTKCGLVHASNISFVGGTRIIYPYGLRI